MNVGVEAYFTKDFYCSASYLLSVIYVKRKGKYIHNNLKVIKAFLEFLNLEVQKKLLYGDLLTFRILILLLSSIRKCFHLPLMPSFNDGRKV